MRITTLILLTLAVLLSQSMADSTQEKYALLNEQWCGEDNCYEILGVKPDAERSQIKGVYKNFSRDLHPDKHPNQTESDRLKYLRIQKAYEILSDVTVREKYDDYLRLKASINSPRESAIVVFILLYAALSFVVLQYKTQKYNTIRKNILSNGKIQRQLLDLFGIDLNGSKKTSKSKKTKKGRRSKSNLSSGDESEENETKPEDEVTNEQIDAALKAENMIVPGWTGVEPDMKIAALSIPKFCAWATHEIYFQIRWQVRYTLMKKKYTDADREYLCRTLLGYDLDAWTKMDSSRKQALLRGSGPWRKGQKKKD